MKLSIMSANYVARELGYRMTGGWAEGDAATQAWFKPIGTYKSRLEALFDEIQGLGASTMDLWLGHAHPSWLTEEHVAALKNLTKARGLKVQSLAVWVPDDKAERRMLAALAHSLDVQVLSGQMPSLSSSRRESLAWLRDQGLTLAWENHGEKTASDLEAVIGNEPELAWAVDTGWLGTQGCDVLATMKAMSKKIAHVHLKDIYAPVMGSGPSLRDMGHQTSSLGEGILPIAEIVEFLKAENPSVLLSFEHEPEDHDPYDDTVKSIQFLKNRGIEL